MTVITWRRACRSPRLAKVTSFSANGRSRFAFASVVVIRPCSNSDVARLASISRSCCGPPPRRGPLVGVGISCSLVFSVFQRRSGICEASKSRADLVLLGLGEAGVAAVRAVAVTLVAVVADDGRRVEARRAVLERETHGVQLALDLVDGLGTEVADVHEIGLTARDE